MYCRRNTWITLVLIALVCSGCSRRHYRLQADAEANCVVDQKALLADSAPGRYRIEVHPMSRMFDPYDPDCPPMPPDDPASNKLLQCVDCKKGSWRWQCSDKTPFVENPGWTEQLPLDEQGRLVLDLPAAVQAGLLHSPDYQNELEDLYLSALDVTFERFRFDAQFFGGSNLFFTADGADRTGTGLSSSELNVQPLNGNTRVQKLCASGGELVVGLANSLVWQFAGPDDYAGTTLLDFTLVQPLLRGAGRAVVLERLTIAERALLSNVRSMERYRRGYYLSIATGRDAGDGASRRGGLFGGAGLEGFTGVGGGGFGRLGGFGGNGGGGGGGGFTGGAGAAAAGGYIGLLQSAQVLRNQRANVAALRESVEQLVASYDAGRIDRFQVDLARQALYNAQSQLLRSEADFESTLDNFKITLGLPPDIVIHLSDPMLDRFNLREQSLVQLQTQTSLAAGELREQLEQQRDEEDTSSQPPANLPAGDQALAEPNALPEPQKQPEPVPKATAPQPLDPAFAQLAAEARQQLQAVQQDVQLFAEALPGRKANLQQRAAWKEVQEVGIDPQIFSPDRLDQRYEDLQRDLQAVARRIETAADAVELAQAESQDLQALRKAASNLSSALLELSLLQARARLDAIDTPPTQLTAEDALSIASFYRRDWANARAALVDTWRLVTFNANDLRSDLDLVFSGDISNVGDHPFALRGSNGRLRVGLEFDAPITRLSERNVYRQSLIEYQQARRSYYRYVDRVFQGLRSTLRQVRLNEINLELRREAVLVAIAQVDITQLRLFEPPKPGEEASLSNTTARDLVQALSDLLNVQNDFLSVWVNNEVQRMNLELDLGVMLLDESGLRIPLDEPFSSFLVAVPCPTNEESLGPPLRLLNAEEPVEPAAEVEAAEKPELEFPAGLTQRIMDPAIRQASWAEPAAIPRRLPELGDSDTLGL